MMVSVVTTRRVAVTIDACHIPLSDILLPMKRFLTLIVLACVSVIGVGAQDSVLVAVPRLRLDFPLIDANHWKNAAYTSANFGRPNLDGTPGFGDWSMSLVKNPSMYQATEWNQNAMKALAWGSQKLSNELVLPTTFVSSVVNGVVSELLTGVSGYVLGGFPLGGGWLHEEYHRAVLATNRVASRDPFDDFYLELDNGSVSNIYDDALRRFKKNDPHSFNRMLVAGGESELVAVRKFQEDNFYHDSHLPTELSAFLYTASVVSYIYTPYDQIDSTTVIGNAKDGADVMARDFTGHDYSGWIWHLFKPYVPYDSLGTHPSGVGINRYIGSDRLNDREKRYYDDVKSQVFLNYLSPMLFGFRKIRISENVYGNFALQFQPTSFGTDRELRLYYASGADKFSAALHQYKNYENHFYALELNWVDAAFPQAKNFSFTSRVMLGTQPDNQEFFTNASQFFGLVSVLANYAVNNTLGAYAQLQAKTAGWVAGDEYLTGMLRLRAGIRLTL